MQPNWFLWDMESRSCRSWWLLLMTLYQWTPSSKNVSQLSQLMSMSKAVTMLHSTKFKVPSWTLSLAIFKRLICVICWYQQSPFIFHVWSVFQWWFCYKNCAKQKRYLFILILDPYAQCQATNLASMQEPTRFWQPFERVLKIPCSSIRTNCIK